MSPEEILRKLDALGKAIADISEYSRPPEVLGVCAALVKRALADTGFAFGQTVRLREDYVFPQRFPDGQHHGWWHARESFKTGAVAVVTSFNLYDGVVSMHVQFPRMVFETDYPDGEWSRVPTMVGHRDDAHVWQFRPEQWEPCSQEDADRWIAEFDARWFTDREQGAGI